MKLFFLLILFTFVSGAYATIDITGKPLESLRCEPPFEADAFSLTAIDPTPALSGVSLPSFATPEFQKVRDPDLNRNFRLDVCLGEDRKGPIFVLKRVVMLGLYSAYAVATIPEDAIAEGLGAAIFEQNYSALKIEIPFHDTKIGTHTYPVDRTFFVQGVQRGDQGFALAGTRGFDTHKPPKPVLQSDVLVGSLVEGDPVAGKLCGPGYTQVEQTLTLGTAKMALTVCTGGAGTSGTFAYTLVRMGVTDSSAHLPAEVRGKLIRLEGPELKTALKYSVQHHNTCDSFSFTLPQATYTATAFTGSPPDADRCDYPRVVAGAPTGTMAEHKGGIGYRTRYADGFTQEGDRQGCRTLADCD